MRNLFLLLVIPICILGVACENLKKPVLGASNERLLVALDSNIQDIAICLWDGAGLREEPGRTPDIKYLTTLYFGEKVVVLSDTITEIDKSKYIKVRLLDGEEGWVNQYLFALGGMVAAITAKTEIYRRPDLMTFKNDVFKRGDIVVVLDERKDWIKVTGMERQKSGWVRNRNQFSDAEADKRLALKYTRAMRIKGVGQSQELQKIMKDVECNRSGLTDIVKESLKGSVDFWDLAEDELYITSSGVILRSEPTINDNNVLISLEEGTICKVLEKGQEVKLEGVRDNWYRIQAKAIEQGPEGWVHGHFTSRHSKDIAN